jgi:hypothetical protein
VSLIAPFRAWRLVHDNDLHAIQRVGRETVLPAQEAEGASQHVTADADLRRHASGKCHAQPR